MDDPTAIELVKRFKNGLGNVQVGKVPWDKYQWIKFVGKGAFGKVDLYKKKGDKTLVAFKEIDLQCMSGIDRRKAMGEVQVLSMLHHPNIVTYYNSYEFEGRLLIEMEYCENGSLADFLAQQKTPLSEKIILKMFSQISAALLYLEQKNILHRDLKTANILIARGHFLKIGDFGIAQVLSTRKCDASTVIGTPFSFSPELCEGRRYTNKSDIWAAGCILYEMICLQRTFEAKNMPALVQKIMKGQIAPIRGNYSIGLRKLIKDLLSLQPDLRPSAFELVIVVEELLRNQENLLDGLATAASVTSTGQHIDTISLIFEVKLSGSSIKMERLDVNCRIVQMSRSSSHTLLLTDTGNVLSFGSGSHGALGLGSLVTDVVTHPVQIRKLSKIVKIAAGTNFSIFLSSQGMVYFCGDFKSLCCGSAINEKITFEPATISSLLDVDVADIACSSNHVVTCTTDGGVYGWGWNTIGCLGLDEEIKSSIAPSSIDFPNGIAIVKVFAGERATMFIDTFGRLWACGDNNKNRIGLGNLRKSSSPLEVKSVKKFVISASINGDNSKILLRGSRIQSLGSKTSPCPKKALSDREIVDVQCGKEFTIATTCNELYFWGKRRRSRGSDGGCVNEPCAMIGDIAIGFSNSSLMDIVKDIGPDYPVIQVKDPKVSIETMADLEMLSLNDDSITITDYISKPRAIVSLYSGQKSKKNSQFIFISHIYCFSDDSIWIIFDSNMISKETESSEVEDDRTLLWIPPLSTSGNSSDETRVPDWIQKELEEADKPKISTACNSDPTHDYGRDPLKLKFIKKLELADEQVRNLQRQKDELQIQISRLQKRLRNDNNCCFIL